MLIQPNSRNYGWIGWARAPRIFFILSAWLCTINGMSKMSLLLCSSFSHLHISDGLGGVAHYHAWTNEPSAGNFKGKYLRKKKIVCCYIWLVLIYWMSWNCISNFGHCAKQGNESKYRHMKWREMTSLSSWIVNNFGWQSSFVQDFNRTPTHFFCFIYR